MRRKNTTYRDGGLDLLTVRTDMLSNASIRPFGPRSVPVGRKHHRMAWFHPPMNPDLPSDLIVKPPNRPSLTGLALLSPLRHYWPESVDPFYHFPWFNRFNDTEYCLESMKQIMPKLICDFKTTLICLTGMPYNHQALLELARLAKRCGATVIVGGHHATFAAELIVRSEGAIDAVCVHQGQEALVELMSGLPFSKIPNLVWRDCEVRINPIVHTPMATILPDLPYIDYGLAYDDEQLPPEGTVAPTHLQSGCHFRTLVRSYCEFCACSEPYTDSLTPEQAVRLLSQLRTRFGITFVNDVSEDLTGNKRWFRAFCEEYRKRPSHEMPRFWQISSRGNISEETAEMLADIGVLSIYLGVESGADEVLRAMDKHIRVDTYRRTFSILMEHGIKPAIGIVAGCSGESVETLAQTSRFVEEFVEAFQRRFGELPYVEFSPLSPRMGAPVRARLMKDSAFRAKHSGKAFPDGAAEARDATPILTKGLTFEALCDWIRKTRESLGLTPL